MELKKKTTEKKPKCTNLLAGHRVHNYYCSVFSGCIVIMEIKSNAHTHTYESQYTDICLTFLFFICVCVCFVFYQSRSCVVVRFRYNQAVFLTLSFREGVWIFFVFVFARSCQQSCISSRSWPHVCKYVRRHVSQSFFSVYFKIHLISRHNTSFSDLFF